ncbi:uncharacterized protein LOC126845482 isoform X1 [Adelges cooleyi]|uniref:uncharacterized protein LOC126845482 isoform X1 n=1 Tax=Adelges cooleyi TaxID=133065 RepID=UPI00217FEB54|nr:uncharacterized protein LOC126845482 isoform X1 [Adelges cooleyi]
MQPVSTDRAMRMLCMFRVVIRCQRRLWYERWTPFSRRKRLQAVLRSLRTTIGSSVAICEITLFPVGSTSFHNFLNKTELQPPYRCALIESARIARGNVLPLHKLRSNVCHHKALIIPDGQGSIKTTLDFDEGKTIIPEVEYVLKEFINARKPIGFMGISALLAPFVAKHPTITLGKNDDQCKWPFRHFIPIAEKLGANVLLMEQNEICHDNKNLMYSTPSTLYSAPNGNVVDIHDACCSFVACMYQIADVCNKNNSIKNCTQ